MSKNKKEYKNEEIVMALRLNAIDSNDQETFKNKLAKILKTESLQPKSSFFNFISMKKYQNILMLIIPLVIIFTLVGASFNSNIQFGNKNEGGKKDDWEYGSPDDLFEEFRMNMQLNPSGTMSAPSVMMEDGANLGFSTGGAKDVNNFRENIKNGYMPIPSDLTYEGLFYDYFFDTGNVKDCEELFCPSYSTAVTKDPFSGEDEYYMSVGLNSGIKERDFERKKLNLVVVLDISGSMSSSFDSYYYDSLGNYVQREGFEDNGKTKMEVAKESIVNMLDHLNSDDRFGMVLFDDVAYLGKPISEVGELDIDAIKEHIMDLQPQGGTNMEAGLDEATDLFEEYQNADQSEYENRIIFLTDAMPNTGDYGSDSLQDITEDNAKDNIYTTFIGIGVDFNTELVEELTKVEGANYYAVHSSSEFKTRLDDEFEFMVTPLVFDLRLKFESDDWEIEKVYGSPEANESNGELMKINTLFPSKSEDGEVKGGVVVLKLTPKSRADRFSEINLKVSYNDREGEKHNVSEEVNFSGENRNYFDNSGIQKAVALIRYVNLIQNWIVNDTTVYEPDFPMPHPIDEYYDYGIPIPEPIMYSPWERQSNELNVSNEYEDLFEEFRDYFEDEIDEIGDDSMEKELDVLDLLIQE